MVSLFFSYSSCILIAFAVADDEARALYNLILSLTLSRQSLIRLKRSDSKHNQVCVFVYKFLKQENYMARYFYGNSELQGNGDGLQTLILMNPSYVGYSGNQSPSSQPANFVFLNPNSSENGVNLPHAPRQHLVGVPLQGSSETQHQAVSNYNLYDQNEDMSAAREGTRAQHGLSLSLSWQQPPTAVSSGSGSVILSSKYLKAAQELLDEVVSVGKVNDSTLNVNGNKKSGESTMSGTDQDGKSGAEGCSVKHVEELTSAEKQEIQMKKAKLVNMLDEVEQRYRQYHHQMQIVISWFEQASRVGSAKPYTALALQTISKQFRCLKNAILGQIRAASKNLGEEDALVAGNGEGSRLKYVDNQIRQQRALQQLGMIQHNAWRPQRGLPERSVTVLRAWLFEHFLHPYPKDSDKIILAKQTGLTRSQVSNWFINARVRLWKPMVEEMYMEEMKGLETTNAPEDKDNNNSPISTQDSISKSTAPQPKSPLSETYNNKTFISKQDHNSIPQNASPMQGRFDLIENIRQTSPKKPRHNVDISHSLPSMNMDSNPSNPENDHMSMKFTLMGTPTNFIGGFGSYPIGELGRYETNQFQAPYSGNGVSLTLGLPHCENLSMGGNHPNFLPSQGMQIGRGGVELGESDGFSGMNTPTSAHSTNMYESINIQNRNKRFASELLSDFVA